MSISRIYLLLPALLLWLLQGSAVSQTRLEGMVLSAEDSSAIAGATVVLRSYGGVQLKKIGTMTKANGSFSFLNLPGNDYQVFVSMIGYREFNGRLSLDSAAQSSVKIFLRPLPIETEQVVVTASKREQNMMEVPVSMSLLSSAAIERRNSLSLDDALRYVPGVNFVQDQVNIRGSSGFAYGIGSRVLVLVDGIPLLSGDTGGANWESIPMEDVDRIEIVKGAGSALYGSNALGGVIDIITKNDLDVSSTDVKLYGGVYAQPRYSEWQWSSKSRFFQGGSISHTFGAGGIGLGDFGLTASLTYKKDDSYIENDGYKNINLFVKSAGNVGANQTLKIFGNIFTQHAGSFLYWEDLNHALQPSDSSLGEWVNSTRANIAGIYTNVVSNDFLYVIRGSYYFNYWHDNFGHPQGKAAGEIGDTSISQLGYLELQGTWNADAATILTFGTEVEPDFLRSNLFTTKSSGSGAIYFQGERKFDRLRTTLGARYDYEKIEGKPAFNQFNPKIGLVYNLGEEGAEDIASLRASIGTGFRAPSLSEIYSNTETGGLLIVPNPGLLPETSLSGEIGGRFPIFSYSFIDASVFQTDFWDMIEPAFNESGYVQFENVTRARVQGYEIDAASRAGADFLTLKASYTYVYPLDLTTHEALKYRSRELFYASLDFEKSIYRASVDFRYISAFENFDQYLYQVVKNADEVVPAYVTDVRAGVDLTSVGVPVVVDLLVNNLFDYYYVEMVGEVAPIRNYSIVVSMKF
jgi:outer membrane receptor for ferrienterochelin and colicins